LEDIYYKDALIIARFFQDKMYPLAIQLGNQLEAEKPNYKAILKVIAESYFEL